MDVTKMADAVFDAVRGYLAKSLGPLADRIKALEDRAPVPGPQGEKGAEGAQGPQGERGEAGPQGESGPAGERGQKGDPGERGPAGEKGLDGKDGAAGRDGRDGLPGIQGEKGAAGVDGKDGRDGRDGVDGLGFDDLSMEYDGERGVAFVFTRGDQLKRFDLTLPIVLDRGVFKSGAAYARGDGVTWGGSFWIAQKDTDTKPGDGDGWRLAVKKGRDGKDGERGDRGAQGERGLPGANGRDLR